MPQEKDEEGFIIPNASNIASNSKISHAAATSSVAMPPVEQLMTVTTDSIIPTGTEIVTTTSTSDELVTSTTVNETISLKVNQTQSHEISQSRSSSDELDTSLELVIDESADVDKISVSPQGGDGDQQHQQSDDDDDDDDDGPYQTKSQQDINEISMELDELYNSLDTDGTLLMDHKMRRKLKKLLRRQKRREERAKQQNKQSDSDDIKQDNVDVEDDVDLEYPKSPTVKSDSDEEKSSKDQKDQTGNDVPKFKTLKHNKHIVRKYRQREQRENERQKKKSERTPLSEGELSSDEADENVKNELKDTPPDEAPTEVYSEGRWIRSKEFMSKELDLSTSELDWVELMPSSPNELRITFTVQASIPSLEKGKINKVVMKTLAERSGSFRGEKLSAAEINLSSKDKKDKNQLSVSPRAGKSPDVIEIFDKDSFLESNELSDEGQVSDSDEERNGQSLKSKNRRKRRRRRSSKHADKHSRSQSRSPLRERRHAKHSRSRSRSRSYSPHRTLSSERKHSRSHNQSQSPGRHRRHLRSRSRSRSPRYEKKYKRSHSRSPARSHRQRKRHSRSRSRSRSRSPHREGKEKGLGSRNDNKKEQTKKRRSRSKSKSPSRAQSQSVPQRSSSANDTDFNSEDMDISSGGETPPLIIDPEKPAISEDNDDADVSRQLEEAMERLKKMEAMVNHRQMVIEDLEAKGSDDVSKGVERQNSKDSTDTAAEKTDEMDKQLIEAVQRLQKMEENYSRRQMLLNNLRQSILDAEKEAGLDVIELDSSKSPEEKEEVRYKISIHLISNLICHL